jgi:hypothetical protein
MKKVLLSVAMAIAAIANTQAQQMTDGNWWGYIPYPCERIDLGNGEEPDQYQAAILVPGYELDVRGKAIDGIRFYLRSTEYMSDLSVWLSTALPGVASVANVEYKPLDIATVNGGYDDEWGPGLLNEVYFSKPYAIPKKGLYIGYSLTINYVESEYDWDNGYPLVTAVGAVPNDNASFVSMQKTLGDYGWMRMNLLFENPNVCIQAHIVDAPEEGDDTGIENEWMKDEGRKMKGEGIYDLQGRPVSYGSNSISSSTSTKKGIQIFRMADGSAKKIVVR